MVQRLASVQTVKQSTFHENGSTGGVHYLHIPFLFQYCWLDEDFMMGNVDEQEKQDNENYSKNFTRTPNIVFASYKHLSKEEKYLYIELRFIYWDTKPRYVSLRELNEMTAFSIGALSKMLPRLHTCGLIHAEIRREKAKNGKEKGNPKYHITILDIWELNRQYFSCSPNEQDAMDPSQKLVHEMTQACSPNDTSSFTKSDKTVHEKEQGRAQSERAKKDIKTLSKKEVKTTTDADASQQSQSSSLLENLSSLSEQEQSLSRKLRSQDQPIYLAWRPTQRDVYVNWVYSYDKPMPLNITPRVIEDVDAWEDLQPTAEMFRSIRTFALKQEENLPADKKYYTSNRGFKFWDARTEYLNWQSCVEASEMKKGKSATTVQVISEEEKEAMAFIPGFVLEPIHATNKELGEDKLHAGFNLEAVERWYKSAPVKMDKKTYLTTVETLMSEARLRYPGEKLQSLDAQNYFMDGLDAKIREYTAPRVVASYSLGGYTYKPEEDQPELPFVGPFRNRKKRGA